MFDNINSEIPEEHRLTIPDSDDPGLRWFPPGFHKLDSKATHEDILRLKQDYLSGKDAAEKNDNEPLSIKDQVLTPVMSEEGNSEGSLEKAISFLQQNGFKDIDEGLDGKWRNGMTSTEGGLDVSDPSNYMGKPCLILEINDKKHPDYPITLNNADDDTDDVLVRITDSEMVHKNSKKTADSIEWVQFTEASNKKKSISIGVTSADTSGLPKSRGVYIFKNGDQFGQYIDEDPAINNAIGDAELKATSAMLNAMKEGTAVDGIDSIKMVVENAKIAQMPNQAKAIASLCLESNGDFNRFTSHAVSKMLSQKPMGRISQILEKGKTVVSDLAGIVKQ